MLSIFRQNQSVLALVLAGYVLLLRWPALFGFISIEVLVQDGGGVLYRLLPEWVIQPGQWSAVASAVLVWLQAIAVNRVIERSRLLPERNWFPGVFYVLAASCLPELHFLSPALLAASFTPALFRLLIGVYNKLEVSVLLFDLGFFIAVGSLVYPPFFWLVFAVLLGLRIWRSFSIKERIILMVGIVVVYFIAFTAYFWFDRGGWFWEVQLAGLKNGWGLHLPQELPGYLPYALLAFLLLFVVVNIGDFYRKRLIQEQKFASTLLWFMAIGLITFIANPFWQQAHWALVVFPVGVLLAYRMQSFRSRGLAEGLHLIFILLLYVTLFYETIQSFFL